MPRPISSRAATAPVADAITVNSYLGRDSLEPFVAECRRSGRGIFCLVKTSNPGGVDVQDLKLTDGTLVWQQVAKLVAELGEGSSASAGCPAWEPSSARPTRVPSARRAGCCPRRSCSCSGSARRERPPADVARAFTSGPASALVSVSRSINYAFRDDGADWRTAAAAEAARLRDEVWRASGW